MSEIKQVELDYEAMWQHLKDHMTYLTQQGVMSLHPIIVMDCMDSIQARTDVKDKAYDAGHQDGFASAVQSVEEWYDPTP